MHGPYGSWGGGWGLLGLVAPLLIWGGLIAGLFALVRGGVRGRDALPPASPPPPPHRPDDPALLILRERYARGEIDSADYEERRRLLRDDPPSL